MFYFVNRVKLFNSQNTKQRSVHHFKMSMYFHMKQREYDLVVYRDFEQIFLNCIDELNSLILNDNNSHLYTPVYKSFMESQFILTFNYVCECKTIEIQELQACLYCIKPYLEPKVYNRFTKVFVNIIKFILWCDLAINIKLTWSDASLPDFMHGFFFFMWEHIGLALKHQTNGVAFENHLRTVLKYRHALLTFQEEIQVRIREEFYRITHYILNSRPVKHQGIFPIHRAINRECKSIILKIQKALQEAWTPSIYRPELSFPSIEDYTWEFTFEYQYMLDAITIEIL